MSEPLLKISNHHMPGCSDPQVVDDNAAKVYVGYFVNEHGQQWIFTRDHSTKKATLRGGNIGWNVEHEVVKGVVPDLSLSHYETQWLRACWGVATVFDTIGQ
ncbi:MAG: hypothetical protein IIA67_12830 [Planctomycetes bacterium]|nr:hypothetical protein [Planctomycetota bacterium]